MDFIKNENTDPFASQEYKINKRNLGWEAYDKGKTDQAISHWSASSNIIYFIFDPIIVNDLVSLTMKILKTKHNNFMVYAQKTINIFHIKKHNA